MTIARIPDSGAGPERQGPRTRLTITQIQAVRRAVDAGMSPPAIAREYSVSTRTIYRYLTWTNDPIADVVVRVVADANDEFVLGLSASRVDDIGRAIMRRLRDRGWVDPRPA